MKVCISLPNLDALGIVTNGESSALSRPQCQHTGSSMGELFLCLPLGFGITQEVAFPVKSREPVSIVANDYPSRFGLFSANFSLQTPLMESSRPYSAAYH